MFEALVMYGITEFRQAAAKKEQEELEKALYEASRKRSSRLAAKRPEPEKKEVPVPTGPRVIEKPIKHQAILELRQSKAEAAERELAQRDLKNQERLRRIAKRGGAGIASQDEDLSHALELSKV